MKTAQDPRHRLRIGIIQQLFSYSFMKYKKNNAKTQTIINNLANIDPMIIKAAPEYPLDKISKVDLAILRLAVFELLLEKKEPPKVIIDEAVELAKSFGGEGSPPFINGVLGTILENENRN